MKKIFFFLFYFASAVADHAVLQGDIILTPKSANPKMVEPGTPIALSLEVENSGKYPSHPANIYIRYAYANTTHVRDQNELFRTEEKELPSIPPGKKVTIYFKKEHKWPSIFEFIRQNWTMRQYQAVAHTPDCENIIGISSIAFSMHYYPGPKHELPKDFPCTQE